MIFLDSCIKELLETAPGKYPTLTNYVKKDEQTRLSLSEHLSHAFLFYGLYGGEALKEWEEKQGWQQFLFQRTKKHWDYPYTFNTDEMTLSIATHFHLFNIPTIPVLYRHLFDQVEATTYHRAATPHFVDDILTDRSLFSIDQNLQKKNTTLSSRAAFHSLAKQPNRLFANLAKATLSLTSWIHEKDPASDFSLPKGNTILAEHQKRIFDLSSDEISQTEGGSSTDENTQAESDSSIEIHAAPSRIREVEVVLSRLTTLFSNDPTLESSDVVVFAPDIEKYAATIEFVFGQTSSPFGYMITDICDNSRLSTPSIIASFFHLALGRFHPKEIFELITAPCCNKAVNLKEDDIKTFWSLFEKLHVHWGYDKEMRQEILETENVTEKGTFKDAFDKLIGQLSFLSSPIELSQSEHFGELIIYIERIATDIRNLKNHSRKIGDWIETLTRLVSDYFIESDQRDNFLKEIAKLSSLEEIVTNEIPFAPILKIIDEITSGKEGRIANKSKPPISFSSIAEGVIASPHITILLGMDEDAFPRSEQKRSIDEIRGHPKADFRSTITEKDKLFFFEAIAYTIDHLIISYTHISEGDGKELFFSLLVEDLIAKTPNLSVESHPPLPFSREAFESNPLSPSMHALAKAHYFPKSATLHKNTSDTTISTLPSIEAVEIAHLTRLNIHPIRFFLQKRCGIYLEGEDVDVEREMREFMLSYRLRSQISQQAYFESKESLEKDIEENSLLPTALFSIAAKVEMETQIAGC